MEAGNDVEEGARLLAEGQIAGAVDEVEAGARLPLGDDLVHAEAAVERGQRIVAAPDELHRTRDARLAVELEELGARAAGTFGERRARRGVLRTPLGDRALRRTVGRGDALREEGVGDVRLRIGDLL